MYREYNTDLSILGGFVLFCLLRLEGILRLVEPKGTRNAQYFLKINCGPFPREYTTKTKRVPSRGAGKDSLACYQPICRSFPKQGHVKRGF